MNDIALTELPPAWQRALQEALAVRQRAYAPYSGFQVGAAILTASGALFTGVNVENASYGLTLCAERTAAATAVTQGHTAFALVAITGSHRERSLALPVSPCGACRQFLFEFKPCGGELHVLMANADLSHIRLDTIDALLPAGFGPELD